MGSNIGERKIHLRKGLEALGSVLRITAVSSIYETDPVGGPPQGAFLNLTVRGWTGLGPRQLLRHAQGVERRAGRTSRVRNGPRTLDVDLLFFGSLVMTERDLEIPHPRLGERAFVLIPLTEVAGEWVDPTSGLTVAELRARLGPEPPGVRLYEGGGSWDRMP